MATADLCEHPLHDTLSRHSISHALEVLSAATGATVMVFDGAGQPLLGPTTGSSLIKGLLGTPEGRRMVIEAHHSALGNEALPEDSPSANPLLGARLDHFAIPIVRNGTRTGTMTLGDRPRRPIPAEAVAQMESAAGLEAGSLLKAAEQLEPWSADEASAARDMAALVAELFAELCSRDEELRNRIEELTTVYNIAGLLADTRDLQEILNRAARMVCEVMKVKACSIRMLDESTGALSIQAVHNLSDEYLSKGPVNISENPIDSAAIAGEIVRIADAPTDPRTRYPEQARKEGLVSGLVCGMVYRGKPVGVMRVYTDRPHVFSTFEEALLQGVASQAAAAIVNVRLRNEAIEAERYTRQMAYAGAVQRRMIPAKPPEHEGAEIGAVYRPTFEVGGDFYDFIKLPQGNLGIAIADVVGKGVPASLMMASLRSALRVYAYHRYDIDQIFAEVNRHVCRETSIGEFATAIYGVLSPDSRRFTYCNAGHEPPLLLRKGEIQHLRIGGMVLGVDPQEEFERELIELRAGDVLLMYTDGANEALNFNDEMFGRERLMQSLRQHAGEPASIIVKNIIWDIRRFRGLADRTDDVTLVVLKVK